MTIGSLLIQPQKLSRAAGQAPVDALVADALAMVSRLVADGVAATPGGMVAALQESIEATGERLLAHCQAGLERARQRLTRWLATLQGLAGGLVGVVGTGGSGSSAIQALQQLLDNVAGKLDAAASDRLRSAGAELSGLLRDDLGLSEEFVFNELWGTLEDIATRLEVAAATTPGRECENARLLASILRRIVRQARATIHVPRLDAAALSELLIKQVNKTGWFVGARKAACVGKQASKAVGALGKILEVVPLDLQFRTPAIGAAAAPTPETTYLWYPSWVLGDDYHLSADGKTLFKNWESVKTSPTPMTVADVPEFVATTGKRFTFGKSSLQPDRMECLAWHSSWIEEMCKWPIHWVSYALTKSRPFLYFPLGTVYFCQGMFSLVKKRPLRWWVLDGIGWTGPANCNCCCCACCRCSPRFQNPVWAVAGPVGLTVLLQSLFWHGHFSATFQNYWMYWITCILPDVYKLMGISAVTGGLRDALLGICTMLNIVPGGETPFNAFATAGVEAPLTALGMFIFVTLIPRDRYFYPGGGNDQGWYWFLFTFILAPAITVAGMILWTIMTQLVFAQQQVSLKRLFADSWPRLALSPVLFLLQWIMTGAGDTDGGKYNPAGTAYAGYPAADTSPYLLPYKSSEGPVGTFQVNMGYYSHQAPPLTGSEQVYAYDFDTDERVQLIAARPGTVVYVQEQVPDDETDFPAGDPRIGGGSSTPNSIYVLHNLNEDMTPWAGGAVVNLDGATGGQFKLSFNGGQTADIAVTATAAQVQAALALVGTIGAGNVAVTAGAPGGPYTVKFQGAVSTWNAILLTMQNGTTAPTGGGGNRTVTIDTPPPSPHDVDPTTGRPAFTIARYLHGRTNSVTSSLASTRPGLTAAQVQAAVLAANGNGGGTPIVVRRGEAIMLSGDTGNSFHNHLHLDLRTATGGASTDTSGNSQANTSNFSVPFVFKDVKNIVGGPDGVPLSTREYASSQP